MTIGIPITVALWRCDQAWDDNRSQGIPWFGKVKVSKPRKFPLYRFCGMSRFLRVVKDGKCRSSGERTSHTVSHSPSGWFEQSVRVTCVLGCRKRLIRSTFFPVEKHEVCRMELFPVTPTNHVPYTTMISTDDVQCGWVRVVMNETHLSVFHSVWKSRSRKALEKHCLFRGSLCFQLIVLVSSKRLYNIHVTWFDWF